MSLAEHPNHLQKPSQEVTPTSNPDREAWIHSMMQWMFPVDNGSGPLQAFRKKIHDVAHK